MLLNSGSLDREERPHNLQLGGNLSYTFFSSLVSGPLKLMGGGGGGSVRERKATSLVVFARSSFGCGEEPDELIVWKARQRRASSQPPACNVGGNLSYTFFSSLVSGPLKLMGGGGGGRVREGKARNLVVSIRSSFGYGEESDGLIVVFRF
ncbi:hypothetical protein DY000_02021562 [Brassica cretica]|uniref:Uncharacterized protein n=1 Tax=Brassica cretica TaxID=69181 RepID=A0ABQ7EHE5_BRACR|nr:hypothetical protein DY000_02021562 [Brassica cretica]